MEIQVGVKALLKNGQGKYLLLHRSSIKYPNTEGTWDVVGGRINPGTKLLENLEREVREETGLKIIGRPKLIAAQDILRVEGKHIIRLTYLAIAQGEPDLDKEESDEFRWASLAELKNAKDLDAYLKDLLAENSTEIENWGNKI